jgi:hypothetical protein
MRKTKRNRSKQMRSKRMHRRTIHNIKGGWKDSNKAIVNISYEQLTDLYNYLSSLSPGTPLYQETYAHYIIMREAYLHEQTRIAQQEAELRAQQEAELRAPSILPEYSRYHLNRWNVPNTTTYNLGNITENHPGYNIP